MTKRLKQAQLIAFGRGWKKLTGIKRTVFEILGADRKTEFFAGIFESAVDELCVGPRPYHAPGEISLVEPTGPALPD